MNRSFLSLFFLTCLFIVSPLICPIANSADPGFSSGAFEKLKEFDFRINDLRIRDGRIFADCRLIYLKRTPNAPRFVLIDADRLPWSDTTRHAFEITGIPKKLAACRIGYSCGDYVRLCVRSIRLEAGKPIRGEMDVTRYFRRDVPTTSFDELKGEVKNLRVVGLVVFSNGTKWSSGLAFSHVRDCRRID